MRASHGACFPLLCSDYRPEGEAEPPQDAGEAVTERVGPSEQASLSSSRGLEAPVTLHTSPLLEGMSVCSRAPKYEVQLS